ncbi:hypothetical protein SLA2020_008380 [Shorea laevis]
MVSSGLSGGGSNNSSKGQSTTKEVFINHAEISWHEMRRQWVGDQSQRSKRIPREPIMRVSKKVLLNIGANSHLGVTLVSKGANHEISFCSWTTTYEDLLCSTEPFHQPIPLAEMVDLLVDVWHEEGLDD